MADHKLALDSSLLSYIKVSGKTLTERTQPFNDWTNSRRCLGVWPYSRVLIEPALHHTVIADENGFNSTRGINFSSQDYLGLANRQVDFTRFDRHIIMSQLERRKLHEGYQIYSGV